MQDKKDLAKIVPGVEFETGHFLSPNVEYKIDYAKLIRYTETDDIEICETDEKGFWRKKILYFSVSIDCIL